MDGNQNNFNIDEYSNQLKNDIKNIILNDIYRSYVETDEAIDKFSNWSLAISGTMIPLILLNIEKIKPFYSDLNPRALITILLFSSIFGLISKYIGFRINILKPMSKISENVIAKIKADYIDNIESMSKIGKDFTLSDKDTADIFKEFQGSLNFLARWYFMLRKFLNPDFIKADKSLGLRKATKLTSYRYIVFSLQLITLLLSFLYLFLKLK